MFAYHVADFIQNKTGRWLWRCTCGQESGFAYPSREKAVLGSMVHRALLALA